MSGLWLGLAGGAVVATRWYGTRSLRDDFGFTARPIDVPIGLVAGVLTQVLLVPIVSWPVEKLWSTDVNEPTRSLLDNTVGSRLLLYLIIIVGAPLAEELFFRGLLLRSLAKHLDDLAAVTVSALLFSLSHFKAAQIPGLFVVGMVLAALARRYGRLGPAIAAHMVFNATALILAT